MVYNPFRPYGLHYRCGSKTPKIRVTSGHLYGAVLKGLRNDIFFIFMYFCTRKYVRTTQGVLVAAARFRAMLG